MLRNIHYLMALISVILVGCENPYKSPIPDVPVDISLNMISYDPTFGGVINDTLLFVCPRAYPPFAVGYGGVLIVVGYDDNLNTRYFSYDLSCPHEASRVVRVHTPASKSGYAVCPNCGSEYYLTDGWGRVSKGPSKYPLKRYETNFVNNFLIIRN